MAREVSGGLVVKDLHFAVAVSRFNDFITSRLLSGAIDELTRHGCKDADITCVRVPGSLELALVAKRLAESGSYDAVICLGCVIRGQTPHFDYVAAETAKGIAQAGFSTGVPVTLGVITADTLEQAIERAGTKAGNKGADAARTAIEMANLLTALPGNS